MATDPTIDFCSEKFDAYKALTTPGVRPPQLVKPLPSFYACRSLLPPNHPEYVDPKSIRVATPATPAPKKEENLLPKQHLLQQIAAKSDNGPLGVLKKYYEEGSFIRVIIRAKKSIYGFCEGKLVAFDKHWNIILSNVHQEVSKVVIENDKKQTVIEKRKRKQLFIKGDGVVLVYRVPHK